MTLRSTEIHSHPESRVHNSQPHGIGRVAALDGRGAWNNLGRNLVFAGPDLQPCAVFDESSYLEDEPSQYDLDIHSVHDLADGTVVALNHFGTLRAFAPDDVHRGGPVASVSPVWSRAIQADVERTVVIDDRLVTSRPRADRAPGVLVSEPLRRDDSRPSLDVELALVDHGFVGALASATDTTSSTGVPLVVGGGARIAGVDVDAGRLRERWAIAVDFEPEFLVFDDGMIWAAGSATGPVDDYDWEAKRGGGFALLDPLDGTARGAGPFAVDLAWGNGGVPLAVVGGSLCGLGRHGEVHVFDPANAALRATTQPHRDTSAGIGHAAVIGDHLVFGYNRDGYRLHALPTALLSRHLRTA